jgi:hypothetical protein
MSSLLTEHTHPATQAVAELNAGLDQLAEASLWSMRDSELAALVVAVEKVGRRVDALKVAVLQQADVAAVRTQTGARTTPLWLRGAADVATWQGRARLELGRELGERPATAAAFAVGDISQDAATAICQGLRDLPAGVPAAKTREVEQLLIEVARDDGTRAVNHHATQIRYRFGPEMLEESERRTRENRFLALTTRPDGSVAIKGLLDKAAGALVGAVLGPLAAPTPAADGTPDPRDCGARYADALAELCQRATPGLPEVRGERPNVALTISWETLQSDSAGHAPAMLDTGAVLSFEAVRKLLCDANIYPVVLGGSGEALDIGRASRVVPTGMRRALVARDQGCTFPGCDRPPSWCDAHHIQYWSRGGPTALSNLTLLCSHHHDVVHHAGWDIQMLNHVPWFIPPPWIDPDRQPRRNSRHKGRALA